MQVYFAYEDNELRRACALYMESKVPDFILPTEFAAAAVMEANAFGVVLYSNYHPLVPEMTLDAAGEGAWINRSTLRQFFSYPFIDVKCSRVTTIVSSNNTKARKFQVGLGFTQEGVCREAMPGGVDAIVYGLLKRECRWIEGVNDVNSEASSVAA